MYKQQRDELITSLMKVVKRVADKTDMTPQDLTALAKVADVLCRACDDFMYE